MIWKVILDNVEIDLIPNPRKSKSNIDHMYKQFSERERESIHTSERGRDERGSARERGERT